MLSYWERTHFLQYEYIIIGAGLVGLSTAIELKAKQPNARVLVLERGIFPTGASTKNAGFACFGSLTELLDDLEHMSVDQMLALVELRWKGLLTLRDRLGDDKMGLTPDGGYELVEHDWAHAMDRMAEVNQLLLPIFNKDVYQEVDSAPFGFAADQYAHLVKNPFEAGIDTGMMMQSLLSYAREKGIEMLTGAEVVATHTDGTVVLQDGPTFRGEKVCVTTNAFTKSLLPELDLEPGRGIVFITHPIENLPFQGVFHMDAGYFYFRNVGNRILFGGGRNLDKAQETTTEFAINERLIQELHARMERVIIPNKPYEIDMQWAGIMAFGPVKAPIVQQLSDHLHCAVRMGGMGVAIGSQVGEMAARQMLS